MIPPFPRRIGRSALAQGINMSLLLPFLLGRSAYARLVKGETMPEIVLPPAAVASIDGRGFWLRCRAEEPYLPFALFPWFEHATVAQLCRVECIGESGLYWPALDVEPGLDRIRSPMAAGPHAERIGQGGQLCCPRVQWAHQGPRHDHANPPNRAWNNASANGAPSSSRRSTCIRCASAGTHTRR